ncbi:DNA methyltransferase [Paenibacillus alvei]|nr:DNA methyltransferase [Paenibacillus alvei]MBG9744891.1 DNA methyltransferase [Paenibacillus alvei]
MIDSVFAETLKYLEGIPKEKRKTIGQFFTSVETARYMASMFTAPSKSDLSILDPGAGSGILTAAVVDRLQNVPMVKHINITCYETSEDILPMLRDNLTFLKENSNIPLDFEIKEENYITSQSDDFNGTILSNNNPDKYDWIISNPPYKKIPKDAVEAKSMPSVCYGAPNLYFLFTAMGLFNLNKNGEMVYIIPRSWTSGAYFKSFRDYLLNEGTLRQIHLFVSRSKVFEKESVLQETIIIKVDKSQNFGTVKITSSNSNSDFENISTIEVSYDNIVFGSERYVYLATTDEELRVLQILGRWKDTLLSLGLKMRTGLTVDFRSREYLRNEAGEDVVPLFYSQHIQNGRVVFPIQKEDEYITVEKSGLIQRNKNYLLVKRFTAKEEKRRLQCGIYLSSDLPEYNYISTQNKVNFIEGLNFDISKELVYGLFVLFNSTIYDQYYRILNGSTQVNSTEVNAMPIPPLAEIEDLGITLLNEDNLSVETCDRILEVLIDE